MMKQRLARLMPLLLAALVFYFVSTDKLYAPPYAADSGSFITKITGRTYSPAADSLTTNAGGSIKCKDIPAAAGGVLLGRIMPCLMYTIGKTSSSFSAAMIDMLAPLFYSFLVFVITMFGLRMLQGERELHQQAFLLGLKITLVVMIFNIIPTVIVPAAYATLDESVSFVTTTLGPETSSIKCDLEKFGDSRTPLLWRQMDCVLGKLYGFTTGDPAAGGDGHNMILSSSVLGLMTGFFFGGTFGATVFFMCIGLLVSVFMLVIRVALAYVNGYLIICVMLIISPLYLPLTLLRVTNSYFEAWWKAIIGALLLPVLMTAYAMFAMQLYDKMLFADDSLTKQLFNSELFKPALEPARKACDFTVTGPIDKRAADPSKIDLLDKIYNSPFFKSLSQQQTAGGDNLCGSAKVFGVDPTLVKSIKDSYPTKKAAFTKLFLDMFKLFLMGFLIYKGAGAIMTSIRTLVGSSAAAGALNTTSTQEANWQGRINNAQESFKNSFADKSRGGAKGDDFLKRLPEATQNAFQQFSTKPKQDR